jgi:hypothetical protein
MDHTVRSVSHWAVIQAWLQRCYTLPLVTLVHVLQSGGKRCCCRTHVSLVDSLLYVTDLGLGFRLSLSHIRYGGTLGFRLPLHFVACAMFVTDVG